jgi:hypothetical protein
VTLPPWARTEHVILHEVAHGLLPKPHAWHGPEYVGIFLTLVRHTLGEDAGRRFSDKLRQHKASRSMAAVPDTDTSRTVVTAAQRAVRERAAKQRPSTATRPPRPLRCCAGPPGRASWATLARSPVRAP